MDNDVFAPNPLTRASRRATRVDFAGAGSVALAGPAGGGVIDFSSAGGDEAHLMSGSRLGARVSGFGAGDEVDFEAVKYASTDKLDLLGRSCRNRR